MFRVIGVHPVEAPEPCFLLEVKFRQPPEECDWVKITQRLPGLPSENWQVPYDERPLDDTGERWAKFVA